MESLENKITENRFLFDDMEPENGHYDRFRQKLGKIRPVRKFYIPYYLKVAVVLILVSFSSIFIYEMIISPRFEKNRYSFGKLSPEYREVEDYFIHTINVKYNQLQKLDIDDKTQKNMIIEELNEMDKIYQSLSKELQNDPNNERIINAMIQHYQLKLDILNEITNQLEIIKNSASNNNQDENTEI
jgi:hypothetical protein